MDRLNARDPKALAMVERVSRVTNALKKLRGYLLQARRDDR